VRSQLVGAIVVVVVDVVLVTSPVLGAATTAAVGAVVEVVVELTGCPDFSAPMMTRVGMFPGAQLLVTGHLSTPEVLSAHNSFIPVDMDT